MEQTFALILACIFLYCYIILSSIEFGAAVFQLAPKLLGDNSVLKTYLSPVWETTNVFLVFFVVGIFTFFPGSIIYLGTNLLPIIFTALVFAGLRVAGMLLIFYGEVKNKIVNLLFAAVSFLFPLILCGFYLYCLSGQTSIIPQTLTGWALWLFAIGVIKLISATFFRYFSKSQNPGLTKFINFISVYFFASLIFLIFALLKSAPYLFTNSAANLFTLILLGASALLLYGTLIEKKYLSSFLAACACVAVIFFSLVALHLPYIVYPSATIYDTFTDPAAFKIMMLCLPIGLVIVTPALILLYRLFAFKKE